MRTCDRHSVNKTQPQEKHAQLNRAEGRSCCCWVDPSLVKRRRNCDRIEKTPGSVGDGAGETFTNAVVAVHCVQPGLIGNAYFLLWKGKKSDVGGSRSELKSLWNSKVWSSCFLFLFLINQKYIGFPFVHVCWKIYFESNREAQKFKYEIG